MKTKIAILFSVLLIAVVLSGCATSPQGGTSAEGATGQQTSVTTTYAGEGGETQTATTTYTEGTGTVEWCKEGMSVATDGAEAQGSFVITGFETYKGEEYCHAVIESSGAGETYTMDYYFKQENEEVVDAWMIMKDGSGNIMSETHVTG